jgi:hypothetical protein
VADYGYVREVARLVPAITTRSPKGGTGLGVVARGGATEVLEHFQTELSAHFWRISARRRALETPSPVFALEHGLNERDVTLLQEAVRAAHQSNIVYRVTRNSWLPFVVHAAEVGYIYDGVEYWPVYLGATPGWVDSESERDRVRNWFVRFAAEYGGAVPQGAWATTFSKIAWPITHAVLPKYLQVQLARLLYDYRTAWPSLLDDPAKLGVRLHSWSRHYSDRLQKFCQNTGLLGHVAFSLLLSGEGEESPYLESATLDRLIASLNSERQSRRWLLDARRSASSVRARGFRNVAATSTRPATAKRLPAATDPKLELRSERGVWKAYAILPDVKPLEHSLPRVFDAVRMSRAVVAAGRVTIPAGGLLYAVPPVELKCWPWPSEPFLQLQRASQEVNLLMADQCRITPGPWWVFRRKPGVPAVEVRGKFMRPGHKYCIVGQADQPGPDVAWLEEAPIEAEGVRAFELEVPTALSDGDWRAFLSAGISVVSDVHIRPVGLVTGGWDGEGSVEWMAGEPGLIVIHAEHAPPRCRLTIDGDPYFIEWGADQSDLFLSLDGLAIGTHEVVVSLGDADGDGRRTEGTLITTIRDPQVRPETASAGEGIRLRTSPAQPSLPEVWDSRAIVEIDGPAGMSAQLDITLRDHDGRELKSHRRDIELPVTSQDWRRLLGSLREAPELVKHYDDADLAEIAITRSGIGFASLSCERGFRGLRWVISSRHRVGYVARLIDRTDGDAPRVDFFSVERPLVAVPQHAGQEFVAPARGGLLWASNGELEVGQIIPPDPNEMLRLGGPVEPIVSTGQRTLTEAHKLMRHHQRWLDAESPASPFGLRERQRVLEAITSTLAAMVCQGRWASFEAQVRRVSAPDVDLDCAQSMVGDSPRHRELARAVATGLWRWNSPGALIQGFADVIANLAVASGMSDALKGARFLLQLARSPGELLDWDATELDKHLRCALTSPVLMRAARFAVLGTTEEVAGGIG